jgi:hypothetical protein
MGYTFDSALGECERCQQRTKYIFRIENMHISIPSLQSVKYKCCPAQHLGSDTPKPMPNADTLLIIVFRPTRKSKILLSFRAHTTNRSREGALRPRPCG